MSTLTLNNIHKTFGKTEVLKGIDLAINEGEFVVFVGPSGCGKSTLLRIIAGLEEATSGSVSLDDEVIDALPPANRSMAMVFQTYALYPHLNVRDNMALGLKQAGTDKAIVNQRVEQATRLLQLDDYLTQRPAQLSGGQRQRVAIGRAIVREPKLFLFDEPLSNLDAGLRANTRLEIARLHHRLKATMIYVTHDQTEAMTLADRIVVLNDGQIEQVGTPMQLYRQPATRFVASFIGSPAMNFVSASALADIADARTQSVGIRPEQIILSADSGRWHGHVVHTENLGPDTIVYLDCEGVGTLTAHLFGEHNYPADTPIYADIDSNNIHHFDSNGQRLPIDSVNHTQDSVL